MIARLELERSAREYLRAARILQRRTHGSYDAAHYLCGYAVELALKARICRTLNWTSYPPTSGHEKYRSLLVHNPETLLTFSGVESRIKPALATDWSVVKDWNPEQRYEPVGTVTARDAADMIAATRNLLKVLL